MVSGFVDSDCRQHMERLRKFLRLNYQTNACGSPRSRLPWPRISTSALGKNQRQNFPCDDTRDFSIWLQPRSLSQCHNCGSTRDFPSFERQCENSRRLEHPFKAHTLIEKSCKFPLCGLLSRPLDSPAPYDTSKHRDSSLTNQQS